MAYINGWLPPKFTKTQKNIIFFLSCVSLFSFSSQEVECVSPEKASERAKQLPSVSVCVAHLADDVWSLNAREASENLASLDRKMYKIIANQRTE